MPNNYVSGERQQVHSRFCLLSHELGNLDTVHEVVQCLRFLDLAAIEALRWKLMLIKRALELLDNLQGAVLEKAVTELADAPLSAVQDEYSIVPVLLNYMEKRGLTRGNASVLDKLQKRYVELTPVHSELKKRIGD